MRARQRPQQHPRLMQRWPQQSVPPLPPPQTRSRRTQAQHQRRTSRSREARTQRQQQTAAAAMTRNPLATAKMSHTETMMMRRQQRAAMLTWQRSPQ
jgi:hypothetical protein